MNRNFATAPGIALLIAGCSSLPESPPPLVDMVEPLELFQEPDDESERQRLPTGGFTGAYVGDARDTLEAALGDAEGVEVVRIVENSPADLAGLVAGDLLLQARVDGRTTPLEYPSQWRGIELRSAAGDRIDVVFDRAGRSTQTTLEVVARARPPARRESERWREEQRLGVVVRTATEVEARRADLAPGGGAVIVGLSKSSPLRRAGLRFGDLVVSVGELRVDHPQVMLDAVRAADESLTLTFVRDREPRTVEAALTERASELRELWIPFLLSYESTRGHSTTSVLFGLFGYESTEAAWRVQLLWFFGFGGGDAAELLEVDE